MGNDDTMKNFGDRITDSEIQRFLEDFNINTPSGVLMDSLRSMKPGALEQLGLNIKRYGRSLYQRGLQEGRRNPS